MLQWLASLFLLSSIGFVGQLNGVEAYFGLTAREPLITLSLNVEDNHTAGRAAELIRGKISNSKICDMMKLEPRQRKLCKRGEGVAEALVEATRLSAIECTMQFQTERWNCTLGQHRINILKRGMKETAFLYAVSSAALVHSVARSCSSGQLDRCTCDETFNKLKNREAWLWGGCGDNIKYAVKFTNRFLRSKKRNKDLRAKMDRHNGKVGAKVVKDGMKKTCKCHGVSGSCEVKTCWLQLSHFHKMGTRLKSKYEKAVKVTMETNTAKRRKQLKAKAMPRTSELAFIERSRSFCLRSSYSFGTVGRVCDRTTNCDVMCCGRGYNIQTLIMAKPCNCTVIWCCKVKCDSCEQEVEINTCK